MNTGKVNKATVKNPVKLVQVKSRRVMTVNYFNLQIGLPKDQVSLLNFLIKEATNENRIKYSTRLLEKYRAYVRAVEREFKCETGIKIHVAETRNVFVRLIELGLLERESGNVFIINRLVTYVA